MGHSTTAAACLLQEVEMECLKSKEVEASWNSSPESVGSPNKDERGKQSVALFANVEKEGVKIVIHSRIKKFDRVMARVRRESCHPGPRERGGKGTTLY